MKILAILLFIVSSVAHAESVFESKKWIDNLTTEKANRIGIDIIISENTTERGCVDFEITTPKTIDSKDLHFITAYLSKDNSFAGGFDLALDKDKSGVYKTALGLCKIAVSKVKFNFGYGAKSDNESYIITFPIKPM